MIFNVQNTSQLINALDIANNNTTDSHTIFMSRGVYTLTAAYANYTGRGATGLPAITSNVTIVGNGSVIERTSTAPDFRIFYITTTGKLTANGLTIRGGKLPLATTESPPYGGAGLLVDGTLVLRQCFIVKNFVNIGVSPTFVSFGGGILVSGGAIADFRDCEISDNTAFTGAGIYSRGTTFIKNSKILRNMGQAGGGIVATGISTKVNQCKFIGNSANDGGALRFGTSGIAPLGPLEVSESDFFSNIGNNSGACLFVFAGVAHQAKLRQCRIVNNTNVPGTGNAIQNNSTVTSANVDAKENWWGKNTGPNTVGADKVSANVTTTDFLTDTSPVHQSSPECDFNDASRDTAATPNPISLRLGEKRLEETDITINTPAGALSFIRSFAQSRKDLPTTIKQPIGLGWTHNHNIFIDITGTSPTQVATLSLPSGGTILLNQVSSSPARFVAQAGSNSYMVEKTVGSIDYYELVTPSANSYRFFKNNAPNQPKWYIASHIWSNGDEWQYGYDSDNRLSFVQDVTLRKLLFTYYNDGTYAKDCCQRLY